MTVYLGSLGRMVELYTTPSASVVAEERYTFSTTLEGRRKAQVLPVGRRTWTWNAGGADPGEVGTVMSFVNGEWGNGPFVFVSADAPVTNMLTPGQASCDPLLVNGATNSAGGPMLTPDGWAGRSYMNSDPVELLWFGTGQTPVIPGMKVTASAYLLGASARARLYFYDAGGVAIEAHLSTVAASAGVVVRSHVTAVAPATAVSCRVLGVGATQGARPAITWTPSLFDWADGQGCSKAVLHAATRDITLAGRDPSGGRYSSLSFTVTEVG